jgi:hypothetical protein
MPIFTFYFKLFDQVHPKRHIYILTAMKITSIQNVGRIIRVELTWQLKKMVNFLQIPTVGLYFE